MSDTRKIVQITGVAESDHFYPSVVALADDGSLWRLAFDGENPSDWRQLPALPKKETEAPF